MNCFLGYKIGRERDLSTFQIKGNNMGAKSAGLIAILAPYNRVDKYQDKYPETAHYNNYVDYLGQMDRTGEGLVKEAQDVDMKGKEWIFSGDCQFNIEIKSLVKIQVMRDVDM